MLFYNEDWIHFIWTRYEAGIEITEEILKEYIYSFRGSQVTDFVMNVNGTVSTAPSEVLETFAQKYLSREENAHPVDYRNTFAANAYDLICNKKIDMYEVWITALKEIGIRPRISVRVNDCHGNMNATELRKSTYVDARCDHHIASHRSYSGYFDKCLDYTCPSVRNRMVSYIREMLERYDVYGLELDLMRDFIFTKPGFEEEINLFLREVRNVIGQCEKKHGHRIRLSLLLPSSPAFCLERGVNILDYADILESVTIISRWETTDTDMPIELWKQLLSGTKILLGTGQQLLYKPYRGYKPVVTSLKMAFGQAMANLSRGSDFVYLYNYMDLGKYEGAIGDWLYEDSIRNDRNRKLLFENIGEMETLLKQQRSHVVTYADFVTYSSQVLTRLPVAFTEQSGYELIRIPVGKLPDAACVRLLLGVRTEEKIAPERFEVYVNSAKCSFAGVVKINEKIYEGSCYTFDITKNLKDILYAEVCVKADCLLEYVEAEVV